MRDGEGLRAGVLLDHPGEGGLRGVLHAIARDVAFDVGEADAEGAIGVGRHGFAGVGDDGAAPLGAEPPDGAS